MYITYLCECNQPTLFYVGHYNKGEYDSFYYRDGKIFFMSTKDKKVYQFDDNFSFLYFKAAMNKVCIAD